MKKRTIALSIVGAVLLLGAIAAPVILAPGQAAPTAPAAVAIAEAEQAAIIEAMRPTKRERPVVAIVAWNQATELSDFLSAYGILKGADVADVTVVAEKDEPVQMYIPTFKVAPDETIAAFDAQYPDGADYVVVPAMDPGTDPFIASWLQEQRAKGAIVIGICNGARMVAFSGLLDGRRGTGHWSAVPEIARKHPTMEYVPDRRYVVDDGVVTSTGITSNVPVMIALVEAIGGREVAQSVADELGVTSWDARHNSSAFVLSTEHKKTFVRNGLSLWRHETLGVPISEGVDEVALGLYVDAYSRTQLSKIVITTAGGEAVRSRHGLTIIPDAATETAKVSEMLPPPPTEHPAALLEAELPKIVERYDLPTANIVALALEYPWKTAQVASP